MSCFENDGIDARGCFDYRKTESLAATMIAKKRGLDPELLSMAAMLHDLHAYKTGSYENHVISHCLHDTSKAIKEKEQKRYEKLCVEFGMMP